MNFSSFIFQTSFTRNTFSPRKILIIDEAHQTERQLLSFVELSLSDRKFGNAKDAHGCRVVFPRFDTAAEYAKHFQHIGLVGIVRKRLDVVKLSGDIKAEKEWSSIATKLYEFMSADHKNWVVIFETNKLSGFNKIILKPIFVDKYAEKYLFSKADVVLFMSATILSPSAFCQSLNIEKEETHAICSKNRFPKKNRPILFDPFGNMNYRNKYEMLPKMVEKVNEICQNHKDQRGIIHTHTFEIANWLEENCDKKVSKRFMLQNSGPWNNKEEMLEVFKKRHGAIIVAPAMHEGLDLKDDWGRFQIICKIPYPSKGDPQIKERLKYSNLFYSWMTAVKLVQSAGRIIRHKDDWGDTYIIDGNFRNFHRNNDFLLPEWFREAIKWD